MSRQITQPRPAGTGAAAGELVKSGVDGDCTPRCQHASLANNAAQACRQGTGAATRHRRERVEGEPRVLNSRHCPARRPGRQLSWQPSGGAPDRTTRAYDQDQVRPGYIDYSNVWLKSVTEPLVGALQQLACAMRWRPAPTHWRPQCSAARTRAATNVADAARRCTTRGAARSVTHQGQQVLTPAAAGVGQRSGCLCDENRFLTRSNGA